ncbi:MAG: acyltransferase [Bryobacterales bacterium]|nr:acyltransferase [Bryobacterales bacterium]
MPGRVPRPPNVSPAQFPALTGVRFPLCLWVIVHHMTGPGRMLGAWPEALPQAARHFMEMAYVAVGTFFVLSGFLLARGYASTVWDRRTLLRYGIARWARLYPVYFLSLLAIAPLVLFEPGPGNAGRQAGYLLHYSLVLEGWRPLPVDWNSPAWSLSCEVFFYLCLPAALVPLRRITTLRLLAAAAPALAIPPLARALVPGCKPLLHLGDFLIGIAAAGLYEILTRRGAGLAGRGHRLYAPAILLASAVIAAGPASAPWPLLDTALRLANAGLVLGLALGGGRLARALSGRTALLGGTASYAMYILHVPLLWWYKRSALSSALGGTAAAAAFFLAGLVLVAALVYRFLEEPANRWLRRRLDGRLSRTGEPPEKAAMARIPLHC